jgi:hypothetical protein
VGVEEAVVVIGRLVDWLAEPMKRRLPPPIVMAVPWPRLLAAPLIPVTVSNSATPSPKAKFPEKVLRLVRRTIVFV